MRTPHFKAEQEDDYVIITIKAPYCDLKDLDLEIENENFIFFCKPYFLRLNMPGKLKESDASTGKFVTDSQMFVFKIEKLNKGEHFPDLDMLTKLLQPPSKKNKQPKIEIIKTDDSESNIDGEESDSDQWFVEQDISPSPEEMLTEIGYGFANKMTGYLENVQETLLGILDDLIVLETVPDQRKPLRLNFENIGFDKNIYLYQFFDEENISHIIQYSSPWQTIQTDNLEYTDYEIDTLKELYNKEYLLSPKEEKQVLLGLIDILFAYCYDKRTFLFENTVESGWAVNKISATLSWFDIFESVDEVIQSCFRRALIFPLYRNYKLALRALDDLKLLLSLGRKFILKCLLEIHQLFNMGSCTDPRYILNDLFLKDYCVFIQKCSYQKVENLIQEINNITVSKDDLNLDLKEIEAEALQEILGESEMDSDSESASSSSLDSDDDSSSEHSDDLNEITNDIENKLSINK